MGTTMMFYGLAEFPDVYAEHMSCFIAVDPVTKQSKNRPRSLGLMAEFYFELSDYWEFFDINALGVKNWSSFLMAKGCRIFPWGCLTAIGYLSADTTEFEDRSAFVRYMQHFPNGTSKG